MLIFLCESATPRYIFQKLPYESLLIHIARIPKSKVEANTLNLDGHIIMINRGVVVTVINLSRGAKGNHYYKHLCNLSYSCHSCALICNKITFLCDMLKDFQCKHNIKQALINRINMCAMKTYEATSRSNVV